MFSWSTVWFSHTISKTQKFLKRWILYLLLFVEHVIFSGDFTISMRTSMKDICQHQNFMHNTYVKRGFRYLPLHKIPEKIPWNYTIYVIFVILFKSWNYQLTESTQIKSFKRVIIFSRFRWNICLTCCI